MMSDNLHKYRSLTAFLPDLKRKGLILLTGARQTGKTTLAKKHYKGLRYINLDAPENREVLKAVASANWSRDIGPAVIDEAQKEPEIFEKIKYAFDAQGISTSVLLGSSQILLIKKIRESLAGRISIYEIWPLMLSELFATGQNDYQNPLCDQLLSAADVNDVLANIPAVLLETENLKRREAQEHLFCWGGMPALLHLPPQERFKWLKDYEYTYLERDLGDLARLDDLEPFRKFQKLSALRSAQLLSYAEIARDAGISVDTARRYLEYLRLSYQVILLQPYHSNLTSSVVKTPKLYWLDIGLLRQLSGNKEGREGGLYETMVVAEIVKWIKTAQRECEIYFYRTRAGMEVDVLLQTAKGVIGVEIKSRDRLAAKDTTGLKAIAKKLGAKWKAGIVLYNGDEIRKIEEPDIWAVPSHRFFG